MFLTKYSAFDEELSESLREKQYWMDAFVSIQLIYISAAYLFLQNEAFKSMYVLHVSQFEGILQFLTTHAIKTVYCPI